MARKRRRRRPAARPGRASKPDRRWSNRVTRHSNALDLDQGVFMLDDPKEIARALKRSAERSTRRKSERYRSAMSMLTFYIDRAGKNLPATRKKALLRAKDALRAQCGRGWSARS